MSATAEIKPVLVKISIALLSYVLCAAPVMAEERSDRPVEVGISVETFTPPGKDHRGYRLRLETLGYHIAVANPEKCEKHKMMTGLILHDLASYDVKDRGRVRIGNGATVMDVVPDSVAASAGLQAGDEIVTIAGKDITGEYLDLVGAKGTADRVEKIVADLEVALSHGGGQITALREGRPMDFTLASQPGCGGQVVYVPSGPVNAWSDGQYVAVTHAMMNFSHNDDELAFIVAHEMAHNILGHAEKRSHMLPIIGLFGIGSGSVRKQEADADRFATDMLYRTKFDALSALAIFRRTGLRDLLDMGLTHPIGIERMAILRRETARLKMLDQAATGGNVANHAPLGGSLARN